MSQVIKIAIATAQTELASPAAALAHKLQLPLVDATEKNYDYLLLLTPEHLVLQKIETDTPQAIYVDFLAKSMRYRISKSGVRKEIIAKAVGLKGGVTLKVVDATAGFGQDSFILACLGCEVQLIERSPIISALLDDGLKRAALDPKFQASVSRMQLIQADAITWLQQLKNAERPPVIYLDPMFPERSKSAAVKKTMRIFRAIVGNDTDAADLLHAALACATQRVVVKRPRLAPVIPGPKPTFTYDGSSSRFDVYLPTT